MEDDININLFSNIDLKNEQDPAGIFKKYINSVGFLFFKNLLLFWEDLLHPLLKLTIFSHCRSLIIYFIQILPMKLTNKVKVRKGKKED